MRLTRSQNTDRIKIEHPENIVFDRGSNNAVVSPYFYVITCGLRFGGTFHAVTSVVEQDTGQTSKVLARVTCGALVSV